ncbi:MAG: hypothetical protein ACI857_000752 [Arenicella sp.]|jgi:hypothetical protein
MDKLIRIIDSLTGSEIRYFQMNAQQNSTESRKQNAYVILFNSLLNKDESTRLKALSESASTQKGYLYEKILASMVKWEIKRSEYFLAREKLLMVKVLLGKNLEKDALHLLQSLKRQAEKRQDFVLLFEIFEIYFHRKLIGKHDPYYTELFQAQSEIIDKFRAQKTQENLYNQIYDLHLSRSVAGRTESNFHNDITFFKNHNELKPIQSFDNFKTIYFNYWSLSLIEYYSHGATKKLAEITKKRVELFKSEPHWKKYHQGLYIIAISNYLSTIQTLGWKKRQDQVLKGVLMDHELMRETNLQELHLLTLNFLKSISFFGGLDQKDDYLNFIKERLAKLDIIHSDEYLIIMHYELAYVYFIYERDHEALKHISIVLNIGFHSKFQERQIMTRFLKIIIFIRKEDRTYALSLIHETKSFAKKIKHYNDYEKSILLWLTKKANIASRMEREFHTSLIEELIGKKKVFERMRYYFDFELWNTSESLDLAMFELIEKTGDKKSDAENS